MGAYNSAAGKPVTALTKWCPKPTVVGEAACNDAVETALKRLKVERVALLQYHVWRYDDPSYL